MKLLVEPIFKTIQVIWLDKLAGNICKNKKSAWLSLIIVAELLHCIVFVFVDLLVVSAVKCTYNYM
jgi:hypothetical protein